MITFRGIGFLLAAIFTFYLAASTRVGWLLLFDAVLWGAIAVSAIMPWLATGKLQGQRRMTGWQGQRDDPGPMEGDAVEFAVKLRNRGLLPSVFVTVEYNWGGKAIDPERERLFIAWLGRNQSLTTATKVSFQRRGLHNLPPMRVETSVPFGLFRRARRFGEPSRIVVLPRAYPMRQLDMVGDAGIAPRQPRPARIGEQITGSRSYYHGDPLQHIHWRNTARTASAQVKEFEESRDDSLVIVFGTNGAHREDGPGGESESLDHAVRIAASVGNFACRSGVTVRVLAGRLELETSDRRRLLEELALLQGGRGATFASLLQRVPPSSNVLAIVLDTDCEGIETLSRVGRNLRQLTAVVLREPDSADVPDNRLEKLKGAGVSVVECWHGDVRSALAALERKTPLADQASPMDLPPSHLPSPTKAQQADRYSMVSDHPDQGQHGTL